VPSDAGMSNVWSSAFPSGWGPSLGSDHFGSLLQWTRAAAGEESTVVAATTQFVDEPGTGGIPAE
jgi:hypothetical protein